MWTKIDIEGYFTGHNKPKLTDCTQDGWARDPETRTESVGDGGPSNTSESGPRSGASVSTSPSSIFPRRDPRRSADQDHRRASTGREPTPPTRRRGGARKGAGVWRETDGTRPHRVSGSAAPTDSRDNIRGWVRAPTCVALRTARNHHGRTGLNVDQHAHRTNCVNQTEGGAVPSATGPGSHGSRARRVRQRGQGCASG